MHRFWRLTRREYAALRRLYVLAHGGEGAPGAAAAPAAPKDWPTQSVEDKKAMLSAWAFGMKMTAKMKKR